MKKTMVLLILFAALGADAEQERGGSREGHGGDAVVCLNAQGAIESAELFDYYEARLGRDLTIDLSGDSFVSKIQSAIDRLRVLDPEYASRLFGHFKRFLRPGSVVFKARADIPEIDDATTLVSPSGACAKIQLAVQRAESGDAPLLEIDREIWSAIGIDGRGGLFLHEIVYRDEIGFGAANSDGVRAFVALLASDRFAGLTADEYARFARTNLRSHGSQ